MAVIALNRQQYPTERCEDRTKVFEAMTIAMGAARLPGHLLDVSRSGARAHSRITVACASRVIVHVVDVALLAEVLSVDNNRFELGFFTPLNDVTLDRIIRAGMIRAVT